MINHEVKTIDVHQLKNKMDTQANVYLIDVREEYEWQEVHIRGAIHIPLGNVTTEIPKRITDKTQPIYLHCKGGIRSFQAAQYLVDLGYQEVYSVDGGIMDWIQNGYL